MHDDHPRRDGAHERTARRALAFGRAARPPRRRRALGRGAALLLAAPPLLAAAGFLASVLALVVAERLHPLPPRALDPPTGAIALADRHGTPILAAVAPDDAHRLALPDGPLPPLLVAATLAVEDDRFLDHPGIDAAAIARAALSNLRAGRTVSGASTITMQLCRLLDPAPRTAGTKLVEGGRALALERELARGRTRAEAKDEILRRYLDAAPYGGNVVGAEAAARRWFGRPAAELALAEAALLAGLPQSPERLRPDRFRLRAQARRDRVLDRMVATGRIDPAAAARAQREPVVLRAAGRRPRVEAVHAARAAARAGRRAGRLSIDGPLQAEVVRAVRDHLHDLPAGTDAAAVLVDVETGAVLAWVGHRDAADPVDGRVDGATAWRSPGSALKPFVYAAAFDAGACGPGTVIDDAPRNLAGWKPGNADAAFGGEMTASEALARSRNLPALRVAERTGPGAVTAVLEGCGVRFRPGAAGRAGLGIATGAAEVRAVDLAAAWATIARGGIARPWTLAPPGAVREDEAGGGRRVLSPAACRAISAALLRERGDSWCVLKTGTSAGRRDAWAGGHVGRVAGAVWIGRLAGGGHPAYGGEAAAAPLLERLLGLPSIRPTEPAPAAVPADAAHWAAAPRRIEARPGGVRIEFPRDGTRLVALGGRCRIRPSVRAAGPVTWLLDGRPVPAAPEGGAPWLELAPGTRRLVAVAEDGSDAILVHVGSGRAGRGPNGGSAVAPSHARRDREREDAHDEVARTR